MKKNEFRPLPDEFNLGYIPPVKEEEEKEKKKKKKKLRSLMIYAAVVFLILPLTLKTGLFEASGSDQIIDTVPGKDQSGNEASSENVPENSQTDSEENRLPDGTYRNGSSWVCLDQGRGWFFNGEYFIPLTYDEKTLDYRAAGAFPDSPGMALDSTVYYVTSEGTIEILTYGVRMYDPFLQQTKYFDRVYAQPETRYIIRDFSPVYTQKHVAGSWSGSYVPEESYPMAYMTDLVLDEGGGISITVANTENSDTSVFTGSWTLEDSVLKTSFDLPLKYKIETEDRSIECSFEQQPEGILFFTESGYHMYLNIFSSQLFVHE